MKIHNPPPKADPPQAEKSEIQSGFTLVEVTIAITLLALMVMMLYGSFYLGQRAVEKAYARSEESQKLRAVEGFLGGYIRSAYPYRYSPRDLAIYFSGEESRVEFVSALSTALGGRGMSKVRIFWDAAGDGAGALALEEEMPVRVGEQAGGGGYRNTLVLGADIRAMRIDYLDFQGEQERWVGQWNGRERKALPRAIRLTHRGERGEEIRWVFPIMMKVLAP